MAKNLYLGYFLTISRSNISKLQFFLKNRFHSNWRSYLVLTLGKKTKTNKEKYQSAWFWANLETFSRISPNQELFSKIRLLHFSTFTVLTSCKKSEKSLGPLLRKLCYQPSNQPTNQLLPTTLLTNFYQLLPVQKIIFNTKHFITVVTCNIKYFRACY